jgi:hypothetical protein
MFCVVVEMEGKWLLPSIMRFQNAGRVHQSSISLTQRCSTPETAVTPKPPLGRITSRYTMMLR